QGGRKHPYQEFIKVDTSNILFIVGGAFDGLEEIVKRRIQDSSMGFGADIKSKKRMRLGEILSHVVPDDLVQYGMIPEFVGRFPVIATLDDLTEEDLVRILNEPKNAIVKQYKKLFQLDNIELEITKDALYAIARKALTKGTGARALKGVFEEVMIDVMFEIPSTKNVEKVVVTRESVEGKEKPRIVMREIA
ncbi:MAG TPA: ATP-dependent Clp protease ATP-binding subunit ClpX, partial [Pseudothermotoga sp.]|nr:ATP-dependent Clp protease ATP-binding subunit ClpX [Pseudothermotoga sp.]